MNACLNPASGRMSYMGKVMNRAARIASTATSSQVCVCVCACYTGSRFVPSELKSFSKREDG